MSITLINFNVVTFVIKGVCFLLLDDYPNLLDTILEVVKQAHFAIVNTGAERILTQIRIDDRRDKPRKMEDKVQAIS